ncbi:claudin-23 [Perognathus longimembris pacificus]|uniref:claudin-23 n=1 Tax=Perognathus longimembris pacificus TaxID=214514 RepID=UPI002019E882|nr:claudin-23 [Perognathus longimembris pacificus]
MRTPAALTLGLVLSPCGLLLSLVSTVAPGWRRLAGFPDEPVDVVLFQGLWDLCREGSGRERRCGQPDAWGYLEARPVRAARGLMPASLAAAALGLLLAALGARCWRPEPRLAPAGLGGLVLGAAGALGLAAVSWYTHVLGDRAALPAPASPVSARAGYALVLGHLGGCLLLLGGLALALSWAPWCAARRRRKAPPAGPRRASLRAVCVEWPAPPPAPGAAPRVGFPLPRPPPRAYTNPADALDGERPPRAPASRGASSRTTRPCGGEAPLPCDSDL